MYIEIADQQQRQNPNRYTCLQHQCAKSDICRNLRGYGLNKISDDNRGDDHCHDNRKSKPDA
ncbi:MAG: hypothetical protein ACLRPV_14950 [Lacrimispora saccharolytica]